MAIHSIFKIFSSPFDVDCEDVPLQLQLKLIDLQYSEDLKSKFLVYHTHLVDMPLKLINQGRNLVEWLYIFTYICVYVYSKIGRSTKISVFFKNLFILFLHTCYICVCFQLVAFIREHILQKALLMRYSVRLELILVHSFICVYV